MVKEQGRIRLEVTRLQAEELVEAKDILLLQPSKVARTHKELLEKKGITIGRLSSVTLTSQLTESRD